MKNFLLISVVLFFSEKFVVNENNLKIMILDGSKTFVRGFNYSPNLRIIRMYLFREYGEENEICVETYIKQPSLNYGKNREVENEKDESLITLCSGPLSNSSFAIKFTFPQSNSSLKK